jgi:hypothetical protein
MKWSSKVIGYNLQPNNQPKVHILPRDGYVWGNFFEHESQIMYRIMAILEALPCFEVPSQRVLK